MSYTALCGTGLYANEVGCSIGGWIDDFIDNATDAEAAVDAALVDLSAAYDANTTTPTYDPSFAGVSYTFVAPTESPVRGDYSSLQPTAVAALPSRAGLLASGESDSIFARARARITRAYAASIRNALEQTGSMGVGLASPALVIRVAEANQQSAEGISQAALEQAAQEGVWAREDIKSILALEQDDFKNKWAVVQGRLSAEEETFRSKIENFKAQLARESERRGYSQLETDKILKEAEANANVAIQWGRITLEKLTQAEEIIVKMKSAVFQAWLQSADLSMSFQGSQSVSDNSS